MNRTSKERPDGITIETETLAPGVTRTTARIEFHRTGGRHTEDELAEMLLRDVAIWVAQQGLIYVPKDAKGPFPPIEVA